MWTQVAPLGIGQRWDGECLRRTLSHLGKGLDFVEPNLPLDVSQLPRDVQVVTHSSELGLASTGPLNSQMIDALASQIEAIRPPWTGEHFSLVSANETGDLGYNAAPILDDTSIEAAISHVRALQLRYQCPLALEAGPRYFPIGGWDDHGAILAVSKKTDAGILLDLSHHAVAMLNMARSLRDGLSGSVLERTVEIHVTGIGRHRGTQLFHDFHGGPIPSDLWELLTWVVAQAPNLKAVTLEHAESVSDDVYEADLHRLGVELRPWLEQCVR